MTTFGDLVAQVKQELIGYSKDQATVTYLTQAMSPTDTTFTVDLETVKSITRGVIEIDDEMMLVKKFDATSGVVTIFANQNGRGYAGTTATSHAIDAIVTSDPRYPTVRIKEAVNQTIKSVFPELWVFGNYEFKKLAPKFEYQLPSDVENVYKVTFDTIGPSKIWQPSQSWRFNPQASMDPVEGTVTGKTLQIMDRIVPGRTVRVIYRKQPNVLVNDSDDFSTTTGWVGDQDGERFVDLIRYGATARMLSANEAARLQQQAIESTERAPLVPTGAATQAAQYYWALYKQRVAEEKDRMFNLFQQYQTFLT